MRRRDPALLFGPACEGDRTALARLLSIVEQGGDPARETSQLSWPKGGAAYTVGITGAPGAGKSTLTDRLITVARGGGQPVAVLAIDPSSPYSGGAILGDRVRMGEHYVDSGVFIRSMATRGHLGGLAVAAPAAVRLLDAVGFPWILLETVGVGQVEVDIAGAADTTVVVVNPGWGDAVQANKAGLMEIADIFVINKADRAGAAETERDLMGMLELSGFGKDDWVPPIVRTVAANGTGVEDLWAEVEKHQAHVKSTGELEAKRADRLRSEVKRLVQVELERKAALALEGQEAEVALKAVLARQLDPESAAATLAG